MSNLRRDRNRKTARRATSLTQRKIVLIVCEGKETEPQYFNGLRVDCKNPRVTIKIANEHGVPRTIVEIAKTHKHQFDYDSVWCVFDVDEHPNIPDARQMARDNGIKLAISNPCFELWLLLHFTEPPGCHDRKMIKRRLKGYIEGYDKKVDFGMLKPGLEDALRRAKRLDKQAGDLGKPDCNPTTGVYRLVEVIRKN